MSPTKVAVHGALGRMGWEVVGAVCREPGMELVGAIELASSLDRLELPGGGTVPLSADVGAILTECHPDVLVDFSTAKAVLPAVRAAAARGVHVVSGTTGLGANDVTELKSLTEKNNIGFVLASNFAIGAVLMVHLAKVAARHLDYAEIIELHHDKKADAPSGTARSTARAMIEARGRPFLYPEAAKDARSRGEREGGISVHSVRLPGLMAHQEVMFGAAGQTLSIRHDTTSRECYMPGVILAITEVGRHKGELVVGLEGLMGLED